MAKDLVRTRRYISKFYGMKTQLQAVSLRIQTMRSNQQMAEAMKGATKVSTPHSVLALYMNHWRRNDGIAQSYADLSDSTPLTRPLPTRRRWE